MTAFAEQVVALLDHLGADQAVVGGTSLGANVSLEVAADRAGAGARADRRDAGAQQRARGRDHRLRAADVRRPLPAVHGHRAADADPARSRAGWCRSGPASRSTPATSGRARWPRSCTASSSAGSRRRRSERRAITAPALVVGHPADPIHPAADAAMLAEELPNAPFVRARSILEWRIAPERLDREAADFALGCWGRRAASAAPARRPRPRPGQNGAGAPLPRRGGRAAHPQAG